MNKYHFALFIGLLFYCQTFVSQVNYAGFVNPFVGTGGHGHTFPGAVLPFGMVQLSPDTRIDGSWDGASGYHYSDSVIYGFSHTHLSGTGVSDWGDILLMPINGSPSMDPKIYSSRFSHTSEKASPGFYEVKLYKDHIKAELTTTLRTGIHRYSYPVTGRAKLILDLLHRDKTTNCGLKIIDSVTVSGYRISEAWAKEQHVYFVIKFSKPIKKISFANNKQLTATINANTERIEGACFEFDLDNPKQLLVKVGVSGVSEAGALKNLQAEAAHWDFEKYKLQAAATWNQELSKVEITDSDKNKMSIFYTALYHCFIHPSLNMDVDKAYRGRDNKIHIAENFVNYSVFSLWDTYRALNPLFTILQPDRTNDFINAFLAQYKQAGRLPIWELSGNETDCMIGFHSVSVIADAITKGLHKFDTLLAYEAMKSASNDPRFGIDLFNQNGFLQVDDESESVSKTLEYAYDNWCIGKVAEKYKKKDEEKVYFKRAQGFRNLYDDSTGFMRPRKNGNWLKPFYPSEINNHFTEGNSWQYSFYVPHDVNALIKLHGGKLNFERQLDKLFTTQEKSMGREQSDVTGLVGQYAHGNEPSHHMAYLYNYVDEPIKTMLRVHSICNAFYKNSPDGLIGNEDCGQMSAWYVFSAMGMYPVCPGSGEYALGAPLFQNIKLHLDNEKIFEIKSNQTPTDIFAGILLNGKKHLRSSITHQSIIAGGTMDFVFAEQGAAKEYGTGENAVSSSINIYPELIPTPLIRSTSQVFKNKLEVSIQSLGDKKMNGRYTMDGSTPTKSSKIYSSAFTVTSNCTVKAKVYSDTDSSAVIEAKFYKIKYDYDVTLVSTPNAQYAVEGGQSLIDGNFGSTNWRKGNWLGFQSQDFECLIDLKIATKLSYISVSALQDTRSWIIFPATVSFYGSMDNKKFELLSTLTNTIKADDYELQTKLFESKFKTKPLRYIKIVAKNYGKLPEWHQGRGYDAFIFVDELEIR